MSPCTSAIIRVPPQASDNTRHRAVNPSTGEAFLLPAEAIWRVVLCSGQIYYHLSAARRVRRIRDIVLVRLEQIAPFPSDLLIKVSAPNISLLSLHLGSAWHCA